MVHPREIEVLNILYGSEKPMISLDIVQAGNNLSQSTVQAVLRKLLNEGFIEVDGIAHSSNVLSRAYKPTEKSKKIILQQFVDQYKTINNITSINEFIEALKTNYM